MTDLDSGGPSSADTLMARATAELRAQTADRWVEVQDRILDHVRTASRRSRPVRAQAPVNAGGATLSGNTFVSEQVLRSYLRETLDEVASVSVHQLRFNLDGDVYTGLTIVVRVQFGVDIIQAADALRARAEVCLRELLGHVIPDVTIRAMHVHVDDVESSRATRSSYR